MPSRRTFFWQALGLSLLTLVSLGRVVHCGFVSLDDPIYVVDNPFVQQGLTADSFRWAWTTFHAAYWQPLTWLSLQLDASLFGFTDIDPSADPLLAGAWGFHLTNLLLHLGNVLLVCHILTRLTGARWRSFFVAALFAVHPLHVESVAWVTERKDVLSTFFFLLALLAYARFVKRPGLGNYLLLLLLAFLGMASKPMVVTLPAVLLLLDYWPLGRLPWGQVRPEVEPLPAVSWRRALLEKLPLFGLSLAFSLITLHTQAKARIPLGWEYRLAGSLEGYWWYLEKTFWPSDLCILYLFEGQTFASLLAIFSLVLLTGITGVALYFARSRPYGIVGWLWFVGTLLPVSGLFQSGPQKYADRFVYLPHLGLFLGLVWMVDDILKGWKIKPLARSSLGIAGVAILALLTWQQSGYWQDTPTMFHRVAEVTQDNHRAYAILSTYYYDRGRDQEAIYWGSKAMAITKEGPYYFPVAMAYVRTGNSAKGLELMQEALRLEPDRSGVHLEAAVFFDKLKQGERVAYHLQQHLAREPGSARLYFFLGLALEGQGKKEEAVQALKKSLAMDPQQAEVHEKLGKIYESLNQTQEAQAHFALARQLPRKVFRDRTW